MSVRRTLSLVVACALVAPLAGAHSKPGRTLDLSTKSTQAVADLRELQKRVENFQFGTNNLDLAKKIVAEDPNWAFGQYYLSAVQLTPGDAQTELDKAVALSKKSGSDGERRFIAAMVLARGKTPKDAIAPVTKLTQDYPGERVFHMILGQVLAGDNQLAAARAEYEKAAAIDAATPRVHSLLANLMLLAGEYDKARAAYEKVLAIMPAGTAPGAVRYSVAFTHLYEGHIDAALDSLHQFVGEYQQAGAPFGIPEVFIWNSIARINLENGRLEEAMKAYQKGYESVPGSNLDDENKKIWLGRLHHGTGRTLARMGKYDEAWKEAETIRKMIDEGGERGKQFEPAYHYLAGYLKLESGDVPAAIEHLKQSDPQNDPFRDLLLARAYEKAGDKDSAKKAYQEIVNFSQNTIERALSYPEAKRKLSAL